MCGGIRICGKENGTVNFHEFGRDGDNVLVLIHPSLVTWDYFEYVLPMLENDYHLVIPALPGFDLEDDSEFTSTEQTASDIADHLLACGICRVHAIYGCSAGGSIALRMAVDGKVSADHYVMDGGITPYQLPFLLTRFIALRDFCMLYLGKRGGERLLAKAFSSTEFTDEDYAYLARMLKHCTNRTLWRTFDSCNNYQMPKEPMHFDGTMHYWYAEKERKARDWDIKYMQKFVPDTRLHVLDGVDHGDLALFQPERFAQEIRALG